MNGAHQPATPGSPAEAGGRLVPNDHVRLMIELLQPLGPELVRRWVAALLLVHRADRESVVAAVEQRLAQLYPLDAMDLPANQAAQDVGAQIEVKGNRRGGRMTA